MAAVHEVTQTIRRQRHHLLDQVRLTALRAARERSVAPIIAPTPSIDTARRLTIWSGDLHCLLTEDIRDLDDMVDRAVGTCAQSEGFAAGGRTYRDHRRRAAGHDRRHQHAAGGVRQR